MIVFLNGRFVPEEDALVSVFDRSFQYGDGLFETIRVANGRPFRWQAHLDRLDRGARHLEIGIPFRQDQLGDSLAELIRLNQVTEAVVRMALSRGRGRRGYSVEEAHRSVLAMSVHPAAPLPPSPERWRLWTSSYRLPVGDPLSPYKTSNKLLQIMARTEAERNECDEALLLNTEGDLCEASSGNLFWIEANRLHTPPEDAGVLPGITRDVLKALAPAVGLVWTEARAKSTILGRVDGAFLTLSSWGLVEIQSVDHHTVSASSTTQSLYARLLQLITAETTQVP